MSTKLPDWLIGVTDVAPVTDLIIWAWRGDYLNIGAGAEVGIYIRPHFWDYNEKSLDQYFTVKELAMPMKLYLYNYDYTNNEVEDNIIAWQPSAPQWWITGFNPNKVGEADVSKQVMISSVNLSQFAVSEDINVVYDKLKERTQVNKKKSKFVVFDDDKDTVWIMWYGESSL